MRSEKTLVQDLSFYLLFPIKKLRSLVKRMPLLKNFPRLIANS